MKVTVILTCFNRREKTVNCIKSIVNGNKGINFNFIVVDDNSCDGTVEAIEELEYNIHLIKGSGDLYWCGGMRKGIEYFLSLSPSDNDFCLFVNDDVHFFDNSVENILNQVANLNNRVVVGATCDDNGNFTYGLRKLRDKKSVWLNYIEPSSDEIFGDTMNANCVLIRNSILKDVGNFDAVYTHSLGDYDLGFAITKKGYKLISSNNYIGICNKNSIKGTWQDKTLPLKTRIKLKESPKGCPLYEWWHFLNKNFGLFRAIIYSISPFIKIFICR